MKDGNTSDEREKERTAEMRETADVVHLIKNPSAGGIQQVRHHLWRKK